MSSRLNAGLGIGRCGAVAVAACADRFAVSETFRLEGDCCDCACVAFLCGDTAAGAGVEENLRALGTACTARLAALACSIVAVFIVWQLYRSHTVTGRG